MFCQLLSYKSFLVSVFFCPISNYFIQVLIIVFTRHLIRIFKFYYFLNKLYTPYVAELLTLHEVKSCMLHLLTQNRGPIYGGIFLKH